MEKAEIKKLLINLLNEEGCGNPLYYNDIGDEYKEALNSAIDCLELNIDKHDKLWFSWKNNYIKEFKESNFPDDYIDNDLNRLLKKLEDYTPSFTKKR